MNKYFNYCNSQVSTARTWFSALEDILDIVCCFYIFQDIKTSRRKTLMWYPATLNTHPEKSPKVSRTLAELWVPVGALLANPLESGYEDMCALHAQLSKINKVQAFSFFKISKANFVRFANFVRVLQILQVKELSKFYWGKESRIDLLDKSRHPSFSFF